MTQTYESRMTAVHGRITAKGLPKLLAALWGMSLKAPQDVAKLKTKFRYVMDESKGDIRLISGSFLNVTRDAFDVLQNKRKKRPTHYAVHGSLEPADLDEVITCSIEDDWESLANDELGDSLLTIKDCDIDEVSHYSIHPSSAPPPPSPRRRD
jgi:hypothetical protein